MNQLTINTTPIRGRFAPSPSGRMHLGNVFSFLMAWLSVKSRQGEMVLRIEDIDTARCHIEYATQLMEDLEWLGLTWDGPVLWQHDRLEAYEHAFQTLIHTNRAYPCFCSRADWHAASAPHKGDHFIYPGTCRDLTPDQIAQRAALKKPAYRFYTGQRSISFVDRFQGSQCFDLQTDCGDCIIKRADGGYAYQLAVVVDDAYQHVTEVCRGYDLLDSTPVQIALQKALGLPTPVYAHVPLLMNEDGHRLAKRDHDMDMGILRDYFKTPEALYGFLMHIIGWQKCPKHISLNELLDLWHLQDVPVQQLIIHAELDR